MPDPWQDGQRYGPVHAMSMLHFLFSLWRAVSTASGSLQPGQNVWTARTSLSLAVTGAKPTKLTMPSCFPPPQAARNSVARRTAACLSFIGFSSVWPPSYPRGKSISTLLRTLGPAGFRQKLSEQRGDLRPGPGRRPEDLGVGDRRLRRPR